MAHATIRTRTGVAFLVMILPTLGGVALARSGSQPESRSARSLTFGELTSVPFEKAEAASATAPWFRITFENTKSVETATAALVETNPAPTSKAKVPGTVQNLHRVDQQ